MTEYGLPFDGVSLGDAVNAPYSAAEWAAQWALQHGVGSAFPNYGILKGTGSGSYEALDVTATNPVSTDIEIQIGAALVNGRLYQNTAVVTKTIGANASGNPRIDTVILRLDFVAQTIRLVVKQGTPAASPARPTLQQDATYWEIPLADIAVANGFATISQSNITGRQRTVPFSVHGWQPYAFPLNYIQQGNYDGNSVDLNSNDALAIPMLITGNMIVSDLMFRYVDPTNVYTTTWAVYSQDVNDGNTSENTLRRVSPLTTDTQIFGNGAINITIAAATPFALTPGLHWLVFRNHSAANLQIGAIGSGSFLPNVLQVNTSAPTLDQTLDFVTGWTKNTKSAAIMLKGRVFGQTSAF